MVQKIASLGETLSMHSRARYALLAGSAVVLSILVPTTAHAVETTAGEWVVVADVLAELPILPPAEARYDRDLFAEGRDDDGNGCRTRQEVLIEESLVEPTVGGGCVVTGHWESVYDGIESSDPSDLEVDHLVALKEAWVSGAWAWTSEQRASFANDLDDYRSLNAVTSASNQSKSDKDPSKWVPPHVDFRCEYIADWVAVKWRWNLAVDRAERDALDDWLQTCSGGDAYNFQMYMPDTPAAGRPAAPVASPAPLGTGAVSIKGPSSELLPGVTVEIRKDSCSGQAVWLTTTTDRSDAYGAFGIGLEAGNYCIRTLSVPYPYAVPNDVTFTMEARPANWVTVWVPGPSTVTGALVAKDSRGVPINGVTAYIREGPCSESGRGVWQATTASNRWAEGGFGITLVTEIHCVSTLAVPAGYQIPAPYQIDVHGASPYWITTWVPGNGPSSPGAGAGTGNPTPAPSVSYANCAAVRAAGAAPIYRGQPGYGSHLDRDGDGVGCE